MADYDKLFDSSQMDKGSLDFKRHKTLADYVFVNRMTPSGLTSDLGRGAFGTVKLVKDIASQKLYAMKIVGPRKPDLQEAIARQETAQHRRQ